MKMRARVVVSGRVQGVFFRANTKKTADFLGLTGWVKNTSDGKVEAVFEGEKGIIEKMLKFCEDGPEGAEVSDVKVDWEEPTGEFNNFEIRY